MSDDFLSLPQPVLVSMARAGREMLEWQRILAKSDDTVVSEVTRASAKLNDWEHYPQGDVYDSEHFSQYYFHVHPAAERPYGEFGHFHTFLRGPGLPRKASIDAVCHLIGIGVDRRGKALRLFTTNRWVTDETWHSGEDIAAVLNRFNIEHARPSWPVNRWVSSLLRLFRPQILTLLKQRDLAVRSWTAEHPERDTLEDSALEVISEVGISVEGQVLALEHALGCPPLDPAESGGICHPRAVSP